MEIPISELETAIRLQLIRNDVMLATIRYKVSNETASNLLKVLWSNSPYKGNKTWDMEFSLYKLLSYTLHSSIYYTFIKNSDLTINDLNYWQMHAKFGNILIPTFLLRGNCSRILLVEKLYDFIEVITATVLQEHNIQDYSYDDLSYIENLGEALKLYHDFGQSIFYNKRDGSAKKLESCGTLVHDTFNWKNHIRYR